MGQLIRLGILLFLQQLGHQIVGREVVRVSGCLAVVVQRLERKAAQVKDHMFITASFEISSISPHHPQLHS